MRTISMGGLVTRLMRGCVLAAMAAAPVGVPIAASAQEAATVAPRGETRALLNLNSATSEQLEALPGVGAQTATRIVEYREKNGPFKKIEDLMNVKGIGEKGFLKLKPLVTVGAARAERPASE